MKCLPDLSLDAALERSPFGAEFSAPLSLERALTRLHRDFREASAAARELAVLRVQMPASLQPIQDGDLFAGRIYYPLVSFSPEPGGFAYACRAEAIREVAKAHALAGEDLNEVEEMLAYWKGRTSEDLCRKAFPPLLARTLPSDAWTRDSAVAFPLYRMAGSVLDYGKLVTLGIPGLRQLLADRRDAANSTEAELLVHLAGALDLLADDCRLYAAQARELAENETRLERRAELLRMARDLDAITTRAPASFSEAIQLIWLYALHSGTWNYGRLDIVLGPFLCADVDSGRLSEAEALRFLQSWWRLMKAYDNQYNNRVIIGGLGRPDEAAADRFALLAMEATRTVRLNEPQLSLRHYRGQNPALMAKALTVIGEGTTFPMLYNDDVNIPAVAKSFGVPLEEAVHYVPYGCGEYVLACRSFGSPNGVINLAKALEAALHGGVDPWSRGVTGPAAPSLADMRSFDDVWAAYTAQVEHHVAALAEQERLEYEVAGREAPFLFFTLLMEDCIERAKPIFQGGVRYLGGTIETYGNTNAADSLHAINELVFVQKKATLAEVVAACDANFEGEAHARIHRQLLAITKYGNDEATADTMARRVHDHVCLCSKAQAARQGLSSYLVVIINNWANVIFGNTTHATPDGRKSGEALANGNNPNPGSDRSGITAFLNSLACLDASVHAGAVQNMKFSRELFGKSRAKLEAMLTGYWLRGGTQAMITVVSAEDLRSAMAEPEKWGHLMVRVGGFSARFIDLPPGAQLEVLRRTCHS
ncbi:pyruvate formate lyase family protein [Nibricoccus sp. IMCC34717]|uniref:pyruvate formate lyase family protein n=1 Tax=Nibricoccus sp. IMCC34717 TaxID=3034021 RepID=UPI00384FD3E7